MTSSVRPLVRPRSDQKTKNHYFSGFVTVPVFKTMAVMTRKENCPLKNLPHLQFGSPKILQVALFEALSFNCLLCNLHSLKQKTQIKRERERESRLGTESGERKKLRNLPPTASSDSPGLCHH